VARENDLYDAAVLGRLFTCAFIPAAFAFMGVGAVLTVLSRLAGFPYRKVHHWATAPFFGPVVRLSGTRVRLTVDPAFDPDRPSVFCQNHVNVLDGPLAAYVIPSAFCGVMDAWQFRIPIYGWLMQLSHGIGVYRKKNGRRVDAAAIVDQLSTAAAERRRMGLSILTFPEAHRTRTGHVQKFRRGVFMMARDSGMPVVPIAVRGWREVNRKGSLVFNPGHTIDVYLGRQRETAGLDDKALADLAGELEHEVRAFVEHATAPAHEPEAAHQRARVA
jgi:1-acyl-sn-glycerol-3-phosphate acyltransferase